MQLSSSSLCGTSETNSSGEALGKIEDLMVNTTSGKVEYAVVSFGGFLGLGDKLFAVPLQLFRVYTEAEKLILEESKERLQKALGFEKDDWPLRHDTEWNENVHSFYNL